MEPRRLARNVSPASGFTLIEILIVVTVIGIIAGIAIPGLMTALDRARQTSSLTLIRAFGQSLEVYSADNQIYPNVTTVADLIPLLRPYSDSLTSRDGWKHELHYTTDAYDYTLECWGKDGVDGADISPLTRNTFELDLVYANGAWVAGIE